MRSNNTIWTQVKVAKSYMTPAMMEPPRTSACFWKINRQAYILQPTT